MSSQCTVCQLFALYLKVCEEIKQQIWVAGLAQSRIVEVFRFPPPLWRSSSYLSFAGHVLGIRRCFELAFYPGFGWFRFMTHWQGVETTFGSPVSRVDMARWTEDHLCRRTFPGRPVWSGAPMANRFSLVIQMLASMGLTCLGMASSFLYFYIQESGIYPKCDISSST